MTWIQNLRLRIPIQSSDLSEKWFFLRYIGRHCQLVRSIAALLSYILIKTGKVAYGGYCYLLMNKWYSDDPIKLKNMIENYCKLIKKGEIISGCSSFTGFVYDMTFDIIRFVYT